MKETYAFWQPGDFERALAAVRECTSTRDAVEAASRAVGRQLTIASLRLKFDKSGLGSLHQNLKRPTFEPPPNARRATDPAPPIDLRGLDYDEDDPTLPSAREPYVSVAIPVPEIDLVERREVNDRVAREKRAHARLVDELRDARTRQAFLDAAGSCRETPRILPREHASGLREMTPIVLCSDLHVEETVEAESVAGRNEYNLEIADRRLRRFFQAIIWNVEHHRASARIAIRDLVLWLGGDLITGYIHEELVENNALSPTEALLWIMPRLRDGILSLLAHLDLEHIELPCSYGNHGRTTPKTRIQSGAENSFEWLLYHQLAALFAGEPRVHFHITASAHQYVDVYGKTLHFTHGDSVRYLGGVGGLGVPLLKAIAPWDGVKYAHLHHVGHFHQLSDFGRVLVNGSLIGYGPYSQHIRAQYEPPQQMMYFLDSTRGKTFVTPLWCGETADPGPR